MYKQKSCAAGISYSFWELVAPQRKDAREDSAVAFFSSLIPDSRGRYLDCLGEVSESQRDGKKEADRE